MFIDEVLFLVLAFLELGYDFIYGFFEEVKFVRYLRENFEGHCGRSREPGGFKGFGGD